MSFHARCQQRIASTCAHRTFWRRRCVRYYASNTASYPEWFQKVRDDLLSRRPRYHPEELDPTHYDQFNTTLNGFEPSTAVRRGTSKVRVPLAELLTRFNVRVQSAELLDDGTDPFHFPGEPWIRRMWAGGAVKINPGRRLGAKAGTVTPFKLKETVACLERIKDVRLQGTGDEEKIYVTVERCFALDSASNVEAGRALPADHSKRVRLDRDWSESPVTEERNLVFMRAKKESDLASGSSGGDTRYLKAPENPDYSHSLTPTRSLLFRYSAITYNAHLIHLDPTYARDVEGHRNTLVHGPLTLTLMLQVLNKHLKPTLEVITSIGYRNIAPLYCDEEMRICVKKKKRIDTGHSWDVWIEGPTGGMAVKAVARSIGRSADALHGTSAKRVEDTASAALPDVQTVAAQAQDTLHALNREDAGKAQLSQVTREERRQLIRQVSSDSPEGSQPVDSRVYPETTRSSSQPPSGSSESSQPAPSKTYLEITPFSRQWRRQQIGKALRYLYMDSRSPLINHAAVERDSAPVSYSARKHWIGKSLPYLYAHARSPLLNDTERQRTEPIQNPESKTGPEPTSRPVAERKKSQKSGKASGEEAKVRKMGVFRIREMGTTAQAGFRAAERRRAHETAVSEGKRRRDERERADE